MVVTGGILNVECGGQGVRSLECVLCVCVCDCRVRQRGRGARVDTLMFGWCSWLSRQSNTLKVPSSILGSNNRFFVGTDCCFCAVVGAS